MFCLWLRIFNPTVRLTLSYPMVIITGRKSLLVMMLKVKESLQLS
jgi:hypothetical protein